MGDIKMSTVDADFDRARHRIHTERKVRIACVGAGLAGLCFAYKLQRSFQNFELTLYEKNEQIGGVWYENKYPGLACDIPGHNYLFSFEPQLGFQREYATRNDILTYLDEFSSKYDLKKYCRTQTKLLEAKWDDVQGHWELKLQNLVQNETIYDTADILINASGHLNRWKWPTLPGLHDFQGELIHSANWNPNVNLEGKRVGLLGNGSSGQQLLTTIQPHVGKLVHFIRQPNWTVGPYGDVPHEYTTDELNSFQNEPGRLLAKRRKTESIINSTFSVFMRDSLLQNGMRQAVADAMKAKGVPENLIPSSAPGCRRPTPGVGYLEALQAANTEVILGEIQTVTPSGITDHTGREHTLDVIICATGFDTSHVPAFPVWGLGGTNLQDIWSESLTDSYMATAAPRMPNYLIFTGPFFPHVSASAVRNMEVQADYMLQLLDRYQTENIHSFTPSLEASRAFTTHCRRFLKSTVWTDTCRSHFKSGTADESLLDMWPGSSLHFADALRELHAEDFDWVHTGDDRFAWLGNGFSATGADSTSDLAWYIRETDNGPLMSRGARRREFILSGSQAGRNEMLAAQGRVPD